MTAYDERSGYRERMLKAEARAEAAEKQLEDYVEATEKREAELQGVLTKLEAALCKDSRDKSISGDTVEYHLDGQAMYAAINAVRAALEAKP